MIGLIHQNQSNREADHNANVLQENIVPTELIMLHIGVNTSEGAPHSSEPAMSNLAACFLEIGLLLLGKA